MSNKPKVTICPSPARQDYKPDLATRLAIEKAQREQPPLYSLASSIPANYQAAKDRTPMGDKA